MPIESKNAVFFGLIVFLLTGVLLYATAVSRGSFGPTVSRVFSGILAGVEPGSSTPVLRTRYTLTPDFEKGLIYRGVSPSIRGKVNPPLYVPAGETVTLRLGNQQGVTHDLVIPAFDAATKVIGPGDTTTVTFRPQQPGTYVYYCSIADHRAYRMEGKIIVRD